MLSVLTITGTGKLASVTDMSNTLTPPQAIPKLSVPIRYSPVFGSLINEYDGNNSVPFDTWICPDVGAITK